MVVSESGTNLFVLKYENDDFTLIQTIPFTIPLWRKHSITDDHLHLIAYDQVNGFF